MLQLQIYEVPSGVHSLQHLVKNSSMAQAELLRQLLVELLQEVLLGPQTCLALLLAADEMGLRQLRAAALRRAETSFPACTAGSSQAFFALPVGVVKHLLEHAVQKVSSMLARGEPADVIKSKDRALMAHGDVRCT